MTTIKPEDSPKDVQDAYAHAKADAKNKKFICKPGFGWFSARSIRMQSKKVSSTNSTKDEVIAKLLLTKFQEKKLNARTLRWFTPEQINKFVEQAEKGANKEKYTPRLHKLLRETLTISFQLGHKETKSETLLKLLFSVPASLAPSVQVRSGVEFLILDPEAGVDAMNDLLAKNPDCKNIALSPIMV
jgi:hypothetical protein